MKGTLASVVASAAAKTLSAVEASPARSNQHEFNGVTSLKLLLGEQRQTFKAAFVWLDDASDEPIFAHEFVTWYDSRENHATRSEFRLYFPTTDVSERLQENDFFLLLRMLDGSLLLAFAPGGSTAERQLRWLFDLTSTDRRLEVLDPGKLEADIGFAGRAILEHIGLGISAAEPDIDADLDLLLDRFGPQYPLTIDLSQFARDLTDFGDPREDPDGALIAWLEREEALFRQLERQIVRSRLREGFGEDVDAFVSYSLSVQNRRKSRIGHALEHHAGAIWDAFGLQYSKGKRTEGTSRPDFLFPSIDAYNDKTFLDERLTMLAAKSTCKDRWRQILAEADRVPAKHLLTLESGISVNQTTQMADRSVTLVIPR
ncbi:MAG: type II restriction endonuclease [Acidobacteria bacterium]|nr:type II restriction endonuclease [Acidobacteriota bacterium]